MKKSQSDNTEDKNKKSENLVKGVTKTKSMDKKEKNDEPVIIRRAVIINDDEEEKRKEEESRKKDQRRKNDVGFIEKNRNKDYNIVYREKPTKPMTVSELFGIGKKEEPKKAASKSAETAETKQETSAVKSDENKTSSKTTTAKTNSSRTADKPNKFGKSETNSNFNNQKRDGNRPQRRNASSDRGIDKKINDIMDVEVNQKENVREYGNKAKDKIKQNQRQDDARPKKTNRKNGKADF